MYLTLYVRRIFYPFLKYVHWKHPVQEKNSLIRDLFLYAIHIVVVKLHDLVLGKNCLIARLFLYPAFLYPVSSVLAEEISDSLPELRVFDDDSLAPNRHFSCFDLKHRTNVALTLVFRKSTSV